MRHAFIARVRSACGNPPVFSCHCEPVTDVTGVAIPSIERLTPPVFCLAAKSSPLKEGAKGGAILGPTCHCEGAERPWQSPG